MIVVVPVVTGEVREVEVVSFVVFEMERVFCKVEDKFEFTSEVVSGLVGVAVDFTVALAVDVLIEVVTTLFVVGTVSAELTTVVSSSEKLMFDFTLLVNKLVVPEVVSAPSDVGTVEDAVVLSACHNPHKQSATR